jgi:hypothetical protein
LAWCGLKKKQPSVGKRNRPMLAGAAHGAIRLGGLFVPYLSTVFASCQVEKMRVLIHVLCHWRPALRAALRLPGGPAAGGGPEAPGGAANRESGRGGRSPQGAARPRRTKASASRRPGAGKRARRADRPASGPPRPKRRNQSRQRTAEGRPRAAPQIGARMARRMRAGRLSWPATSTAPPGNGST